MRDSVERLTRCILCDSGRIEILCAQNQFAHCTECGLIFDNPRPAWERIVQFYSQEDKYDAWLAEEAGRDDLWKRRLKLLRREVPSGRLLDVGTGIGQFLNAAKSNYDVSGTEISTTALEIAKSRYGLMLHQGTIESLPTTEPFDVLTLFHVLEHVPYPAKTLATCASLLKTGGHIAIAVPNDVDSWLTRRNRWLEGWGIRKYLRLGKLGLPKLALEGSEIHLSHFTAKTLRFALEQAGFQIVREALDPYFVATGLRKWRRYRRYAFYSLIHLLTGKNLYDTLWVIARKN